MHIEILKWLAIIFMVTDHLGFIYEIDFLRYIGRLAFPLFAYVLVYNYLFHTSDKKKYIIRLFLFALISQPFYLFVFNGLNIFFTLGVGLSILYLYENLKLDKGALILFSVIFFSMLIPISWFLDYKIFGILMILAYYYYLRFEKGFYLVVLSIYSINFLWNPYLATIGLFSLYIIFLMKDFHIKIRRMNKWFFYIFYPLHLVILYILKFFLN